LGYTISRTDGDDDVASPDDGGDAISQPVDSNGEPMARPLGAHNQDYEQKRQELLGRLGPRLVAGGVERASFREMAAVAKVSVPTLRHYFANRTGVIVAYLEWRGAQGAPHLALVATTDEPFATSIRSLLAYTAAGLDRARVIELHVVGLTEGLTNPELGPVYLQSILEPSLVAAEARLRLHIERGEMRDTDVRGAALMLLSPVILAMLHQRDLGGEKVRCLDVDAFVGTHADAFIRAYQMTATN
jgi:AcrR family transcriptional regulator